MNFTAVQTVPEAVSQMRVSSIDLGFSELESTVGVVFQPDDRLSGQIQFGDGICRVNNWLAQMVAENEKECILVIEAPLSMALTSHGNPCHRQLELQRNYAGTSPRSPKGWYYQAGANLSLGSTIFLRNLVVPDGLNILLVEGFYCSLSPDEDAASHKEVAAHLLKKLLQLAGKPLVTPRPEAPQGTVCVLPGMQDLVAGIPHILLREGLQLKP